MPKRRFGAGLNSLLAHKAENNGVFTVFQILQRERKTTHYKNCHLLRHGVFFLKNIQEVLSKQRKAVSLVLVIIQHTCKRKEHCFWAQSIYVFSPSTQYLSDGANVLPTLHRIWGLCSTRAVTLSPLLCQPGHGTGVVCKHTHTKWILLGCCSCFSWVSSEQQDGGCSSENSMELVGETPRSDLYPLLGEEERNPIQTRLEVNSPSWASPREMGHAGEEGVLVGGEHVVPAQGSEVWEGGNDGLDGYEHEQQEIPRCVTGPVFLAEPTWRWRWIFHRTRSRNTQIVSSYTSTAQSKSWGDSSSFRTSWIL